MLTKRVSHIVEAVGRSETAECIIFGRHSTKVPLAVVATTYECSEDNGQLSMLQRLLVGGALAPELCRLCFGQNRRAAKSSRRRNAMSKVSPCPLRIAPRFINRRAVKWAPIKLRDRSPIKLPYSTRADRPREMGATVIAAMVQTGASVADVASRLGRDSGRGAGSRQGDSSSQRRTRRHRARRFTRSATLTAERRRLTFRSE